ncbi:unnamed protein product, partial [marine sediment metagenome]
MGTSSLLDSVHLAKTFLENKGEPNDPNVWSSTDIALTYRALLRVRQPYDIRGYLEQLVPRQNSDGSWGEDDDKVFTTALALQALNAVIPPELGDMADLAVYNNYIQFVPPDPNTGQDVNITAQIVNEGTLSAGSFCVEFYNGDPNSGGVMIGFPYCIDGIAPWSSTDANVVFADTNDLYDEQQIVVVVDPNGDVTESSYYNNFAYKTLTFASQPDLKIDSNDIYFFDVNGSVLTSNPDAYEPIVIVAEVNNLGARIDGSFDVNIVDTADSNITTTFTFNNISHDQKAIITLITGLAPGNRTIQVTADSDGDVTESDEGNNSAVNDVNVNAGSPPTNTADLKIETTDVNLPDCIGLNRPIGRDTGDNIFTKNV